MQTDIFSISNTKIKEVADTEDGHGRPIGARGVGVYCGLVSFMEDGKSAQVSITDLSKAIHTHQHVLESILSDLEIARIISVKRVPSKPSIFTLL